MKKLNKYKGTITVGDIEKATNFIYWKFKPYDDSFKKLTRGFLNNFIEEDCFKCSYSKLRSLYEERFYEDEKDTTIPKLEQDFYKYICDSYLDIIENNLTEVAFLEIIKKDLLEIEIFKSKLKEEKNEIESSKEPGKSYRLDKLADFLAKIRIEEEKIISFFINDMTRICSAKNKRKNFGLSNDLVPNFYYSYTINMNKYLEEYYSELTHKLLKYPMVQVRKLMLISFNDNTKFLSELNYLVDFNKIIKDLKSKVLTHNLLVQEKELLFDIFELFNNDKFLLFSFVTPIQIEGLINLYCEELGISENTLKNKPVNKKVEIIEENESWTYSSAYTYFKYDFPIIRNKVAHGYNLSKNDSEYYAKMFLLDLNFIIDSFSSHKLPKNHKLNWIRRAYNTNDLIDMIKACAIKESEIDPFYYKDLENLRILKEDIKIKFKIDEFKKLEISPIEYEEVKVSIVEIKKQGILEETCKKALSYLSKIIPQ